MKKIILVGDSIVKTYTENELIGGWGEFINYFLDEEKYQVYNFAEGGRSSRSFINEGRLKPIHQICLSQQGPVSEVLEAGDYLLIQFGHNDDETKPYKTMYNRMVPLGKANEKGIYPIQTGKRQSTNQLPILYLQKLEEDKTLSVKEKNRQKQVALEEIKAYGSSYYAYHSGGTYKWYLKQYVDFAREKGATPILITSPPRIYFNEKGKVMSRPGHHGGTDQYHTFTYIEAMKQLAQEEKVPLINLFAERVKLYEALGSEKSRYLHTLKDIQGNWPETYNEWLSQGKEAPFDDAHANKFGAFLLAAQLVEKLMKLDEKELGPIQKSIRKCPKAYIEAPEKLRFDVREIANQFQMILPFKSQNN